MALGAKVGSTLKVDEVSVHLLTIISMHVSTVCGTSHLKAAILYSLYMFSVVCPSNHIIFSASIVYGLMRRCTKYIP